MNLTPQQKAHIDLFARAPQVKKMSRKDKQRLALAAAMGGPSEKKPAKVAATAAALGGTDASPSLGTDAGVFSTVFAEQLDGDLALGGAAPSVSATTRRDRGERAKRKAPLLRHALHKNEEEDARTIFVGNLPNTVDKKQVAKVFKDCGAIESVRIRSQALEPLSGGGDTAHHSDGTDAKRADTTVLGKKDVGRAVRILRGEVKKDPHCSATAYVLFTDAASVGTAVEKKNGVVFQKRHLVVTGLDAMSAAYPPDKSVFLGNVAYDTTEEDVWSYFTEKGISDVRRVRLVRDRDSGVCKGFGYVEFHSKSSVEPAIATRGALLNGRELRIVHVNTAKEVKAVTASRREKRARTSSAGNAGTPPSAPAGKRSRLESDNASPRGARGADSNRKEAKGNKSFASSSSAQPSWMGLTTNPRRKIPRDLRALSETNADKKKFKGPRPPVKRKMRNPEK